MELRTPRLRLRPLAAEDAEGYGELLGDPRVHPFVSDHGPVPRDAIPERIATKRRGWETGRSATWAIVRDARFIGYVALHGLGPARVAMSYALLPAMHRLGLATEAIAVVLRHAEHFGVTEIEARTHLENPASVALLERSGFAEQPQPDGADRRSFLWVNRPRAVALKLCRALDTGRWATLHALLAPTCHYDCRGSQTVGRDDIVDSYRSMDDWVRRNFDNIRYDSSVETVAPDTALVTFRDHMESGTHTLDFRCQQRVRVGESDLVEHIVQIDLPGERAKADRFNAACGVTRPG
ncbi:MAG: GNAT family N-acetyltransferase [Myxococcota bacterium]